MLCVPCVSDFPQKENFHTLIVFCTRQNKNIKTKQSALQFCKTLCLLLFNSYTCQITKGCAGS